MYLLAAMPALTGQFSRSVAKRLPARGRNGKEKRRACVQEALPPPHECLILTHNLQSATIQDEHTRLVGSQELGRANLWERPTPRYASHETRGTSGKPPGGEALGFLA